MRYSKSSFTPSKLRFLRAVSTPLTAARYGSAKSLFYRLSILMASDQSFVDYICEQADLPGNLTFKKMFGEYALYLSGKVIALICDNQLFVKPTNEGKALLGTPIEGPPYPGAKLYFQITHEIDDRDFIKRLFLVTAQSLPLPKPKAPKPKSSQPIKKKT